MDTDENIVYCMLSVKGSMISKRNVFHLQQFFSTLLKNGVIYAEEVVFLLVRQLHLPFLL